MQKHKHPKNVTELSKEEYLEVVTNAMKDYHYFCEVILGYYDMNEHHEELCKFLQHHKRKFKLALMPRHTFKSCIITQGYALWTLIRNPDLRILIYSDSAGKAQNFLLGVKQHIEGKFGGSRFREFFKGWEVNPYKEKWNEAQIVISARKRHSVEPSVDTSGIESSKVGMHYDIIFFDDIVSDINVTTKGLMDKVHECYKKSLSLLKPGGDVIMCGTRWHFNDAYGRIIKDNEEKDIFGVFIRQAIIGNDYLFGNCGPNSLSKEFLDRQRAEQGSYVFSCNPGDAPIIMGDFSTKCIEEIKVGDEICGWDRKPNGRKRLRKSKVLSINSRIAETVIMTTKSGRYIRCTPDHNWYTGRLDKTHREYKPAKIGSKLMFICDPYQRELDESEMKSAAWLGGLYDGEGSCGSGSMTITQSHTHNPQVCQKLETTLDLLDYKWNKGIRKPSRTSLGTECTTYWWNGGFEYKKRFIDECSPVKKDDVAKLIYRHGSSFIKEKDEVVSMEVWGKEKVYALQTETGNYIAWGYGSKNCLYQNSPVSAEAAMYKYEDFGFYGELKRSSDPRVNGMYDNLFITGTLDPAGEGEDYTAGTIIGTDAAKRMYVLELYNSQNCTPSQMIDWIIKMNAKYHLRKFGIETTFFRGMLKRDLENRLQQERDHDPFFKGFSLEELKTRWRKGEGKRMRIESMQPYHERGEVLFPGKTVEGLKGLFSDLAYQMMQVTHDHIPEPNDLLDALSWQVDLVQRGGMPEQEGPPLNSPAWLEKMWVDDHNKQQKQLPKRMRRRWQTSLS